MPALWDLPTEIKDVIYEAILPSSLRLPTANGCNKKCPSLLLVCRQLHCDFQAHLYTKIPIEFEPGRQQLAELHRRQARRYCSQLIIVLSCIDQRPSFSDEPSKVAAKIDSIFPRLTAVTLRLTNSSIPSKTIPGGLISSYRLFVRNSPWSSRVTKACVDLGPRICDPYRAERFEELERLLKPLGRTSIPNLSELHIYVRSCLTHHSTGRANAYANSPQRRNLSEMLFEREIRELTLVLKKISVLFPFVRQFRLWRVRQYVHGHRLEPIHQDELLDIFDGRAYKPVRTERNGKLLLDGEELYGH